MCAHDCVVRLNDRIEMTVKQIEELKHDENRVWTARCNKMFLH